MSNLGRKPLQIVEIDVDYCALSYGVSPCTAALGTTGDAKCFNTFKTCQDTANFDPTTLTIRIAKNQAGLPKGTLVFPTLQSVSTNPTRITLGAVDDRLGSLGKRARVNVALKDLTYHDRGIDKYADERVDGTALSSGSYDPATQGTLFGRLKARWPYYYGRALRVKNGYVGDSIASMPTRNYIITEWKGPDADGNISITAQDPLKLTDSEFAQCPKPTAGELPDDIASDFTGDIEMLPAGIGNADYATSGRVSIGSEIMSFTRSGDTLTIVERGLDGTEATDHGAGDTIQQCYVVEEAKLQDVAQELLEDFAGLDAAFIPKASWDAEVDRWLATLRLTRTVPKPVPVLDLMSGLADFGVIFWWDEVGQEVNLKANRPVDLTETVSTFSDNTTVIEGTLKNKSLDDNRVSQVWFSHGILNMAEGVTDQENYAKVLVASDLDAESSNQYDQSRAHKIFSPWLGRAGDGIIARAVASRLLNRYRDTPEEVTFTADIKDRDGLALADLIQMETRVIQKADGSVNPTQMQVTSVEETDPGHRVKVTVETYRYEGRYGFITENTRGTYDTATAEEKEEGTYLVDESTLVFGDGTGPYLLF